MDKCTCSDWKKNIPALESIAVFAALHGFASGVKKFSFCPYCKKKLVKDKS